MTSLNNDPPVFIAAQDTPLLARRDAEDDSADWYALRCRWWVSACVCGRVRVCLCVT